MLTVAAFDALRGDHAITWHEERRYTPALARRLVEQAGLHAVRVSFTFASVFPLVVAARFAQRLLRPIRGVQEDADIVPPPAPVNYLLTRLVLAEARSRVTLVDADRQLDSGGRQKALRVPRPSPLSYTSMCSLFPCRRCSG